MSKAKPKDDPTKCDALLTNGSGRKCKQPAGAGTDHKGYGRCKLHGGASANGRKAALNEKTETMRRTLIGEGYDIEGIDPGVILLTELARTAAVVRWLEQEIAGDEQVAELTGLDPGRAGGYAMGSAMIDIETTQGGVKYKPNIYVQLWQKEREQLAKVAKDCLAVGLKEREVKLAEQQGDLLYRILTAIFSDEALGLTPVQKTKWPAIARKHLTLIPQPESRTA